MPRKIIKDEVEDISSSKIFKGQEVISDGTREVEGKTYRHIRIADGTTYDLTEEEYLTEVE